MIMETKKSHDRLSANWRFRKPVVVPVHTQSLGTKGANGVCPSRSLKAKGKGEDESSP